MDLIHTTYEITVILTFFGGVILVARKGGSIFDGVRALIAMRPKIEEMLREFKPNGGSSLRDRVDVLEDGMLNQNRVLDDQTNRLVRIENQTGADHK